MGSMRRSIEKEQFWGRMLAEQRRSGLGVRTFCRAKAISEPSFYAWRRKLPAREVEAGFKKTGADAGPGRLIPVTVLRSSSRDRVKSTNAARPTAATKKLNHLRAEPVESAQTLRSGNNFRSAGVAITDGARSPLEICTPGGWTLRFERNTDSETLARVLDVLARRAAGGPAAC